MPTATEQRVTATINLAPGLLKAVEVEAARNQISFSMLARKALQWHAGRTTGRHPDSPPVKLPKPRSRQPTVKKSLMIEEQDAEHLDALGHMYGLPRTTILVIILCQYLGLPVMPPRSS